MEPRQEDWIKPRGTPPESSSHYQGAAGRAYHEGKRAVPPAAIPWIARLRARRLPVQPPREGVVFEFGVGYGWNLIGLPCRRKLGYDASLFLAEPIRAQGIEWVEHPSAVPDESVDLALCHHVLEHVVEPATALRELRRVLRPGGTLMVVVPWERERRYGKWIVDEPNHHLYTWNAVTLGNLLAEVRFQLVSCSTRRYGYDRFAALQAVRFRLGEPGFRLLRSLLVLLRPLREVVAVARKPVREFAG